MKIWIEEKQFSNRDEFRIKVLKGNPNLGQEEVYLQHWIEGYSGIVGFESYVFKAYKNPGFFKKYILGLDYRNQSRIAIQKCDNLISRYKKEHEKPKIIKYER